MDCYYKKTQKTPAKDGNSGDRAVTYHYTTGHPNNATIVVPNQQLSSSLKTRKRCRFMGRVMDSLKNTVVSTIQRVVPKRLRANRDQRQNYLSSKVNGIQCHFVDTKGQIRPSLVWPLNDIHNEDEEMLDNVVTVLIESNTRAVAAADLQNRDNLCPQNTATNGMVDIELSEGIAKALVAADDELIPKSNPEQESVEEIVEEVVTVLIEDIMNAVAAADIGKCYDLCPQNKSETSVIDIGVKVNPSVAAESKSASLLDQQMKNFCGIMENRKWSIKGMQTTLREICKQNPDIPYILKLRVIGSAPILCSNRIVLDKYLGSGYFGVVFSAQMNGQKIAVKFDVNSYNAVKRITSIVSKFDHKNIVKIFPLKDNNSLSSFLHISGVIAMEIGVYDLEHWIKVRAVYNQLLDFGTIQMIAKGIIRGVRYLHCRGYSHNDIKPDNILICGNSENLCAKVTDFDLITKVTPNTKGECGTEPYRSPEVIKGIVMEDPRKADNWAIGVTLYLVSTLHKPYPSFDGLGVNEKLKIISKSIDSLFDKIPNIPKNDSTEGLVRVIRRLLVRDDRKRESLKLVVRDEYLRCSGQPSLESRHIVDKTSLFLFKNL